MIKLVVILANSIKHNKHCVAGKLIEDGKWVRLVSNTDGAELSDSHATVTNEYGTFQVKPLQKVFLKLVQHAPLKHQP